MGEVKLYLFERVEELTERYHSGGGLVVIATSAEHAKELIATDEHIQLTDEEWISVVEYAVSDASVPVFYVFPDAGCC